MRLPSEVNKRRVREENWFLMQMVLTPNFDVIHKRGTFVVVAPSEEQKLARDAFDTCATLQVLCMTSMVRAAGHKLATTRDLPCTHVLFALEQWLAIAVS